MSVAKTEEGVDISWPDYGGDDDFGRNIAEIVAEKGWCIVKTDIPYESCADAYKQATTSLRGFDALKEEFVADFQGKKGHGKVAFVPTDYDGYKEDSISMLDRDLTSLAAALAPVSSEVLGTEIVERSPGMVWVPFGSKKEERMFEAEPLTEDDVEEGVLERHILFLMRRGLCLFHMVENDGGELNLTAKDGSELKSASMPIGKCRLLVFKSSEFSLSYEPKGQHLAMATWTLGPDPRNQIDLVQQVPFHDSKAASDVLGIKTGYLLPIGERVHILSLMCRYPGNAFGLQDYFSFLLSGGDGYQKIPEARWDTNLWCTPSVDDRIPGKCYARHGGFCADDAIYNFDSEFFELEHDEVKFMAPVQKLCLEDGYTVLHMSGYTRETLNGKPIGYFVGDTGSDWSPMMGSNFDKHPQGSPMAQPLPAGWVPEGETLQALGGCSEFALGGSSNAALCARIANLFNTIGPVGTVDTACSSSLVATGIAMTFLRPRKTKEANVTVGRFTEAVAAGIATQIGPFSYIGMCALSMISPMGRCFTFDQSGDGYARGEGVGSIHLKASSDADDTVNQLAALLSSMINQDGRSASMTAPNGPSQTAVINASMKEAGVSASDIALAECHGTGTALGDPIEVGALRAAMEPRDTVLCTASAKCHIGHLEGGAGMGGIAKCIAMLQSALGTPNTHLKELNPNLSVSGFPLLFETEGLELGCNSSLTGVSSFGFGGTNGRSDLWAVCRKGSRAAGEVSHHKIGQLVVKCPITMAPIDYLTGEPAVEGTITKPKMADVLRDEFADYRVSKQAYKGGFRYRAEDQEEEEEDELKEGTVPYVYGSWQGFSLDKAQAMELEPDTKGTWHTYATLGEGRYELFSICLDKKKTQSIFPIVNNAQSHIYVKGPAKSEGECWIIDGRDAQVSAGSTYKITLKLFKGRKEVSWELAAAPSPPITINHEYYVVGSFNGGGEAVMTSKGGGSWSCTFKIGYSKKEEFYFLRDNDVRQAIYPAVSTSKPGPAACGPDNLGKGKFWFVRGVSGEEVTLTLSVVDAKVKVEVSGSVRGSQVWEGQTGWNRHSYAVSGSFTNFQPVTMTMGAPGIFTASVPGRGNIVDSFKVLVDGDPTQAYAPADRDVPTSGTNAVAIPGSGKPAEGKFVTKVSASDNIQVVLDLTALDLRKTVTWTIVSGTKALTS